MPRERQMRLSARAHKSTPYQRQIQRLEARVGELLGQLEQESSQHQHAVDDLQRQLRQAHADAATARERTVESLLKTRDGQVHVATQLGNALNADVFNERSHAHAAVKTMAELPAFSSTDLATRLPAAAAFFSAVTKSRGHDVSSSSIAKKEQRVQQLLSDLVSTRDLNCPSPLRTAAAAIVHSQTGSRVAVDAMAATSSAPSHTKLYKLLNEPKPFLAVPAEAMQYDVVIVIDNNQVRCVGYLQRTLFEKQESPKASTRVF